MLKDFRTYQIAKQLYTQCQNIPVTGELRDQLSRASLSIVLNLIEGTGKGTKKDRCRFYQMAFGSIREVQGILDLINEQEVLKLADYVAASTWKLLQTPGGR